MFSPKTAIEAILGCFGEEIDQIISNRIHINGFLGEYIYNLAYFIVLRSNSYFCIIFTFENDTRRACEYVFLNPGDNT